MSKANESPTRKIEVGMTARELRASGFDLNGEIADDAVVRDVLYGEDGCHVEMFQTLRDEEACHVEGE
jgi:hypothetical protein